MVDTAGVGVADADLAFRFLEEDFEAVRDGVEPEAVGSGSEGRTGTIGRGTLGVGFED